MQKSEDRIDLQIMQTYGLIEFLFDILCRL